jgi:hypothetical protein
VYFWGFIIVGVNIFFMTSKYKAEAAGVRAFHFIERCILFRYNVTKMATINAYL